MNICNLFVIFAPLISLIMKDYIVSARKYRPTSFDTVVGQTALITTLKSAVKSGKLAHAYLFCGPRGVGKTTACTPQQMAKLATNVRVVKPSTNKDHTISLNLTLPVTTPWRTSNRSWTRHAYRLRLVSTRCSSSMRYTCSPHRHSMLF